MANNRIDKEALRQKILSVEGLDNETRTQLLGLLNEKKRYGLVWEEKPEEVEEQLREKLPVLKEVEERRILSDDAESPNHILIEGDNLHALTALTYTHEGKVDVIYIDPPYNTGNKDFRYNDTFVDVEDGYRHSKWLSFMSKRLRIAKKLLSDKGVIFISIDDNEQANLKLLCDEVFGEKNFVGVYNWKRTETPPALSFKVRKKFEYVLCYQKIEIPQRKFSQGFTDGGDAPLLNNGNPIGELTFPIGSVHFNIPDGVYEPSNDKVINLITSVTVEEGINKNSFSAKGHFKWQQSNLDREVSLGSYFLVKGKSFSIRYQKQCKSIKVPSNIIDSEVGVDTNEEASKEMDRIGISFDYAKPTSLLHFILSMPHPEEKNFIILDFFAGSGTTLHATMQLNAEDGGKRQCIMVTNNENKICEEVTYERNKRVINGYTTPKGVQVEGLKNNNLRYYKVDFVDRDTTMTAKRKLMEASTDLLCIKQNLYKEQESFGSIKLKARYARYFEDGKKKMLIIYESDAIESLVAEIDKMPADTHIMTYVFSINNYALDADFDDVADKVTLCALPAAIYNAYLNVLPKKATPKTEEDETETIPGE